MNRGLRFRGRLPEKAIALVLAFVLVVSMSGAGAGAEEISSPQLPILLLNGAIYPQRFDPASLPVPFRIYSYSAEDTVPYLIQCEGPIRETWVAEVYSVGGVLRGYVPYNTLLVQMDGDASSRLGELDFVQWSGIYQPYFKISPALQLRLAQGGEVGVLVELFSGRFLQETLNSLSGLPVELLGSEADSWGAVIALRMPVEALKDVAALPAVEWIELCTNGALPGASLAAEAAPGNGGKVTAAVGGGKEKVSQGDTGLGVGGIGGIPAQIEGDVSALYSLRGDDGKDVDGHGTAVAGTLLTGGGVDGGSDSSPPCDLIAYATGYGLGCPPIPLSLYSVLQNSRERGAGIYLSGSVPEGRESMGAYGIYTSQRDAFAWNNPGMALVEAAGNEGTDTDGDGVVDRGSLLGGATAKNVISVGGSENSSSESGTPPPLTYAELQGVFSGIFTSQPLSDDSSLGAASGMAAFSSRGPTRDGRIKPDLVAPATYILTTASGGVESLPYIVPSGEPGYVRAYGTSMAAALITGDLAAMRRRLVLENGTEPSAALLKAFAVNGAADLCPGQYGDQPVEIPTAPNAVEGWGRVDMGVFERRDSWIKVLDDAEGMRLGESRAFRIEVKSGEELRVTLAWTDYPSLPEARLHLVNDLDLRLVDPEGDIHYPNGRSSRDPLNNVERVVLDISGMPGDYTLEITAWNVPISPQPFALVAQVL